MAITVQQFIKLANYYNQTAMLMSAICVQKGGIAMENYVGRFYMADVLEYVVEYGRRLIEQNKNEKLDLESLKRIRAILLAFEREHAHDTSGKGKRLIKRQYVQDRIIL